MTNSRESSAGFTLDARLAGDTHALGESALNLALLMNDRRYRWIILVPKRAGLSEIFELSVADRATLLDESCLVARVLSETFGAYKINVGALGNVVRQLHVHHVARFQDDPAWPGPVWGHSPRVPYAPEELEQVRAKLRATKLAAVFRLA